MKEVMVKRQQLVSDYHDQVKFTDDIVHFQLIARMIFDATGWSWETTYSGKRTLEAAFRRSFIDLIATCNGCSISECARETGRDHTTLMHSLVAIENTLDTERYSRKLLKEVMEYVRENYSIIKEAGE